MGCTRTSCHLRTIAVTWVSLALSGCPQWLSDDFVVASAAGSPSIDAVSMGGSVATDGGAIGAGGRPSVGGAIAMTAGAEATGGSDVFNEGGATTQWPSGGSVVAAGGTWTGGAGGTEAGGITGGAESASGGSEAGMTNGGNATAAGGDGGTSGGNYWAAGAAGKSGSSGNAGYTGGGGAAGGGAAGASTNASGGVGGCTLGAFGAPKQLTGLVSSGELWGSGLSADTSTLFFSVNDGSTDRIYTATRTDRGTAFVLDGALTGLDTNGTESNPTPSFDGLTLYFVWATQRTNSDKDLWFAKRTSTSAQFSNPRPLNGVNTTADESRVWMSRDELTLLLESDRPGGKGDMDIWTMSRKARTDDFATPTNLPVVNGTYGDESPALSNDGLTLYFISNRPGGNGQKDIWVATRSNVSNNFGTPTAMTSLNSADVETDIALSDDGLELFFSSDRSGSPQIWRSIRSCQ